MLADVLRLMAVANEMTLRPTVARAVLAEVAELGIVSPQGAAGLSPLGEHETLRLVQRPMGGFDWLRVPVGNGVRL